MIEVSCHSYDWS